MSIVTFSKSKFTDLGTSEWTTMAMEYMMNASRDSVPH